MSHWPATLPWPDLLALTGHFLMLSMLSIGGAIATAPDMHRYLVGERGWISETQFTDSVALAQAARGPNLLFVAVLSWNVSGPLGALAAMAGMLAPSTVLTLAVTRWAHQRKESRGVRAFNAGLAPVTLGLLLATAWVLADPVKDRPGAWLLAGGAVVWMMATKRSPLWPVAAGALVGALGGV